MHANLEDISSVKKKIMVVIDAKDVDKKLNDAYRDIQKKARIPGFRRGKAPRHILEKRFGDQVMGDVSTELVKETFAEAINQVNIVPLTEPVLDKESWLKQGEDFKYSITVEVRPEFELPEYKGIEIEKEKISVNENTVQSRIEKIREARGDIVSIKEQRPVKKGDFVVVDYEAFEGDTSLEDMKASGAILRVGDNRIHPELDKALEGMNIGEEKEVPLVFDKDDSRPVLAGKQVVFKIKVNDIKELVLPELNDEFAKQLDPTLKGVEDLKEKLKEIITKEEEQRIEKETKEKILEKISEKVDFELPETIVEAELEIAVSNVKRELMEQGADFQRIGVTEEKVREDFREYAKKRVKTMFILGEIARRENIDLTEEEINKGFEPIAKGANQPVETIKKYYETNNMMAKFKEALLEEKTLNFLYENAKIVEVEAS